MAIQTICDNHKMHDEPRVIADDDYSAVHVSRHGDHQPVFQVLMLLDALPNVRSTGLQFCSIECAFAIIRERLQARSEAIYPIITRLCVECHLPTNRDSDATLCNGCDGHIHAKCIGEHHALGCKK